MNRHPLVVTVLLAAFAVPLANAHAAKPAPKFYAYCVEVGVPGLKPRPISEQARILRELGYDGAGYPLALDGSLEANLKQLDEAGLQLYLTWTSVNVNPSKGPAYDPRVPDAIRKLKGRPVTISVLLTGLKPADPNGLEPAIKALRALGDAAAEAGLRVSIYNHVSNWSESLPFIVEVVGKVDHPQVGFNFNLCHWLKVDGQRDYRPLLRANAAKLSCVTICGAQTGAQTWTNGLIQPLDRGDFDQRQLLATLAEIGYHGPVGLMCFGIPDNPREHLARSMKAWRQLQPDPSPAK